MKKFKFRSFRKKSGKLTAFSLKKSFPIKVKRIKPATIDTDTLDNEKELFSALKSKRMELARRQRVPDYIIFPDTTLHQMLLHKPQTLEEMGRLNGVGPKKLEKYGQAFLEVVKGFN